MINLTNLSNAAGVFILILFLIYNYAMFTLSVKSTLNVSKSENTFVQCLVCGNSYIASKNIDTLSVFLT